MNYRDRPLLSFLGQAYLEAVNNAVEKVYPLFADKILEKCQIIIDHSNRNMELYASKVPSLRNRPFETPTFPKFPLPTPGEIKQILRDLPVFLNYSEKNREQPLFQENARIFKTHESLQHLVKPIPSGSMPKRRTTKRIIGVKKPHCQSAHKAKLGRDILRMVRNPLFQTIFLASCGRGEYAGLFKDIEKALLDNGFPDLYYRSLMREEYTDAGLLEERRRMLDAIKNADGLKYISECEFGEHVNKFAGCVHHTSGKSVIHELCAAQCDVEAEEIIRELLKGVKQYPKQYRLISGYESEITSQLMESWENERRKKESCKTAITSRNALRSFSPRIPYTFTAVRGNGGSLSHHEFDYECHKNPAQKSSDCDDKKAAPSNDNFQRTLI